MVNRSILTDIAFCLITLLTAVMIAGSRPSTSLHNDPKDAVEDADREADKLLATKKADALEWLSEKHDTHIVWKWSREEALKSLSELHAAGAKEIWAVDIDDVDGGGEMTATFVIALPPDPAPRKKVLAWIKSWEKKIELDDDERTKDQGQKYYVLSTDL